MTKVQQIAARLRAVGPGFSTKLPYEAADALDAQAREIEGTRRALEQAFPTDCGFTEAFDGLVRFGLIVEVPANEAFKAEWGEDEETMWVWRWHPLAPTTKETSNDE